MPEPKQKLTLKQRTFCEAYVSQGGNGYLAAKIAGYGGDYNTLCVTASDNLRKPNIAAYINDLMKAQAMGANEVLHGLAEIARGDMREFIGMSYAELRVHPKAFLIKKIKHTVVTSGEGEVTERTEIELYDRETALVQMGRYHKLFVDRQQHDSWETEAIDLIRRGEIDHAALSLALEDTDLATRLFRQAGVAISTEE